ncbi:uncharacterized protein [Haliotis cracherodii]|uniref:uncharacterized protein n=1 Tax=Haliotis cracherodii TaxID=6455 RepID=UPI0039E9E26C
MCGRPHHLLNVATIFHGTHVEEYLQYDTERQTKTRTGADARNMRDTKPRAYAIPQTPEKDPVALYKLSLEKRPDAMLSDDTPFFLAITINYQRKEHDMPRRKDWRKVQAMQQRMEEYHLPKKDTGERNPVQQHCMNLARSMNLNADTQFEVTGMTITSDVEAPVNDHDLSNSGNQPDDTASETNETEHDVSKLTKEKQKYNTVPEFRNRKKETSSSRYRDDDAHRESVKNYSRKQYAEDAKHKATLKMYSSGKYATDSEHRAAVKTYSSEKYATDSEHRAAVKTYSSEKYATDSEHRAAVKTYSSEKYATDSEHRAAVKTYSSLQYAKDPKHKEKLKSLSTEKYAKDPKHRETVKTYSTDKYAKDAEHMETVKTYSTEKYAKDAKHRETVKTYSTDKYAKDAKHRETAKTYSTDKYAKDAKHRETVKTYSTDKYAKDAKHRETVKTYSTDKYAKDAKHRETVKTYSTDKYAKDAKHRETPLDIGQEVLDQHFERITCVAPAEENNPVRVLTDKSNEARSFPVLFPSGSSTFHDDREERITLARYLHTRLMNADRRFAQNTDYIFYAQYLSEIQQVLSNVSIAMRKGSQSYCRNVTAENLTDSDSLRGILKSDEGYRFLKPIRGTPPFWQSAQKDLFAMLRQLGVPTWFCSFSSADMRWPEMIETILRAEGDKRKAYELDWSEKCFVLRKNPVTAARMFDQRFHCFLKEVIMSPAEPIGKIKDYFYRVEFQHRGSPHTHCLFWVENAPKIDKDTDEAVKSFIDKYVTCEMPSVEIDEEMYNIVNSVQKHSARHSKSCKKNGTTCRFNFPRPPSSETFISRPSGQDINGKNKDEPNTLEQTCESVKLMTNIDAKAILKLIWQALTNDEQTFESVDALFTAVGISQDMFEIACAILSTKTNVVLKRKPNDVWVNQYNADLLRCWNANMDIQYVVDAYSCVVYIISYISKAEREMGLLLNQAQKEANKDNTDAKSALKKIGAVYLHNREVSAQEAVFRVCNLRLKEGSRKVQFIPTVDPVRMSLPLETLKNKQQSGELDEDEMWMTSIVDRYKSRPKGDEFNSMCLATFCSEYRVVSKSEVTRVSDEKRHSPLVTLQNGLGHVKKRTRTDSAIIRYARFSRTKDPEKYYHSMLQLFLPYTFDTQLKPAAFNSYEEFYQTGAVQIANCPVETVKDIVDRNKAMFEQDAEVIDNAKELFEQSGQLEDAWAQICPETESERLECEDAHTCMSDEETESVRNMPDLLQTDKTLSKTELLQSTVSRQEAETILRSMNEEQADVFYKIRQWCLDKKNGKNPEAFKLFLTGGAGTGKSHLIKAICYESTRLLAPIQSNPDDISVLLVAPTGVAAFNINASTIHSALSIGIDAKLPYQPLELTTIMRQKDPAFAQLLNRLRTRKRSQPLVTSDINMLKRQETGEDDADCIHIFATNAQVDEFNVTALHSKCTDPISIQAQDFSRNLKTGKLEKRENPHVKVYNSVLQKSLFVAIGARVMITKNIDTSDGLVNGVFGTISHISFTDGEAFPSRIYVVFDNDKVGHKLRNLKETASALQTNSTPIAPLEETVSNNGGIRRQFPLKLAWACTIHKVQGITVNKAVVSLGKIFAAGQAYVALSRVSSLGGLIIDNFKESVIYSSEKVEAAVSSMPKFMNANQKLHDGHATCTFIMQNIEGLQSHIQDLQNDLYDLTIIIMPHINKVGEGYWQQVGLRFYSNVIDKIKEKHGKYADLAFEMQRLQPKYQLVRHPIVLGAVGLVAPNLLTDIERVPAFATRKTAILTNLVLQKAAVLESLHILRKVLGGFD